MPKTLIFLAMRERIASDSGESKRTDWPERLQRPQCGLILE